MAAERKEEARTANAAARREQQDKNDAKKRMKGKNKPSRRQRKKQLNIIEERKGKQLLGLPDCLLLVEDSFLSPIAMAQQGAAEGAAQTLSKVGANYI